MDEEEAKTEYCSNCKRDIPAANFVMHVTHCQRNLTLCKVCGEPIPTSQQEEHFEEYHAKDKCDCGQLVERMNLEEHKEKDCPNRGVECQYCELTLPFDKMASHVEYCGSRTEKCDTCDRFIQMKDLTEHVNTGCQYPVKEESKKLPSNPPQDFFPGMPVDMLHAMGLMDPSGSSRDADYFHPFVAGMHEFGRILNTGFGTSPFSDEHMQYPGAAYFGGIDAGNGEIDGKDVIARGAKQGRAFPKPEFDQDTFRDFDKVDDEYAQDVDDDEILAAAFQADEFDNANGDANGMSSAMVDEPFPYMKSTPMADSENDADKTQLPCEFCGDLFTVEHLILHQSGCQLGTFDSLPGSASHFPYDSTKHNLPHLNNSTFSGDRKYQTNHTDSKSKGRRRSEDDTFLPCEFCQELFPFENLIAHQAVCDACPASRPPSALFDGSTQAPPLNNARPTVRNGSKSRPSRPVYESKKTQKSLTTFIPRELDDGDDLDFTPSVNDDLTTRDLSRKQEKYSDRSGGLDSSPMNNELQRLDRRTVDHHSMHGDTVLRNNDLAARQPSKVVPRVKNRTADQPGKGQPAPRSGLSTSYKAPAAKLTEDGLSQKKMNIGSRSKPAAEPTTKPMRVRPTDIANGSKLPQPSMNDETERSRRDSDHKLNMQSHKSEIRASKPRRVDTGGLKSDSSSAMRAVAARSRTKGTEPLPPLTKPISVNGSSLHSAPSNPRRNPPTTTIPVEQSVRSNRGRPRAQGTVESVRSSNTPPTSTPSASNPPGKTSSRKKKIV